MSQPTSSSPDADRASVPTTLSTTSSVSSSSSATASSAASSAASDDPLGFVWDLKANPCFRSSLMWGIGLGGAMGVHAFTRHRLPYKASDTAVKTFFVVSSLSWLWCRHQARKEKELFDAVINMEMKGRQGRKAGAHGEEAAGQVESSAVATTDTST